MRFAAFLIGLTLTGAQAAHSAPLEAYGRLPSIEQIEISPAGNQVALVSTEGEARLLSIINLDTGASTPHVRLGDIKLRDLMWAGDNNLLVTTSRTAMINGLEGPQREYAMLTLINLTTGRQSNPLDKGESSLNVIAGPPQVRTVNGRVMLFTTGIYFASSRGSYALYKTDVESGRTTRIEDGDPATRGWLVDANGEPRATTLYEERTGKWSLKVRPDDRWVTVESTTALIDRPHLAGWGRDGKSILLVETSEQKTVLEELTLTEKPEATPVGSDFSRLIHDPRTHALLGTVVLDGDQTNYNFYDAGARAAWTAITRAFPDSTVTLSSWSDNRRKIIALVRQPRSAPAYALVDLDAKKAEWLGTVYALETQDVGEVRPISYKAGDGLTITGYLTLPPGTADRNLPLIVLPHGGPATRDTPHFDWLSQAIASRGYAVLQPNFRGSDGFGWSFLSAGFGEWGGKMQTDLSDGVRHLASIGTIDPARVCIAGASYGGYAALAGVAFEPDVYRCAASIAGVTDLERQLRWTATRTGSSNNSVLRYWDRFMGAKGPNDPRLDRISPAANADKISAPVLLIHGREDTVVPIGQSRVMEAALKRAGRPAVFQELKGEDHWLSRSGTRLEMLSGLISFLEKHNPPARPPALASAAQIP